MELLAGNYNVISIRLGYFRTWLIFAGRSGWTSGAKLVSRTRQSQEIDERSNINHCWIPYLMSHLWWSHQMETFSALLALCAGNSPASGEFPAQKPVTRSFDVFLDLILNKRLRKQSWGWWYETLSRPLWRHRNVQLMSQGPVYADLMEWRFHGLIQTQFSAIDCIYPNFIS